RLPARAPTDPDVRVLTHPVLQLIPNRADPLPSFSLPPGGGGPGGGGKGNESLQLGMTGWPSQKGPRSYPSEFRGQVAEPRCAPPVSRARVCQPTLRFPPQGPPGRVPLLHRYYQSATTSCRPSRRTSLPSFGGTSAFARSFRSPADECAAEAWSLSPGCSGPAFAEETTGSPKFLDNPNCPFAMFS